MTPYRKCLKTFFSRNDTSQELYVRRDIVLISIPVIHQQLLVVVDTDDCVTIKVIQVAQQYKLVTSWNKIQQIYHNSM